MRGAKDDIEEITGLLKQMGRYRAQFSDMKQLIQKTNSSSAFSTGATAKQDYAAA